MNFSLKTLTKTKLAVLSLLFIVLILIIGLLSFSEKIVQGVLTQSGVENAKVEDIDWSPSGTVLKNIDLPSLGLHIDKVTLYALAGDIGRGRLTKVVVDGFTYIPPASVPDTKPAPQRQSAGLLLFPDLNIHVVELTVNGGMIRLSEDFPALLLSGEVFDRGSDYQAAFRITAEPDQDTLAFDATASVLLNKASGTVKAQLDVNEGQLATSAATVRRLSGWFNLETHADGSAPVLGAQLAAGSAEVAQLPLTDIALTVSGDPAQLQAMLSARLAQSDKGSIRAEVNLARQPENEIATAEVDIGLADLQNLGISGIKGGLLAKASLIAEKPTAASYGDLAQYTRIEGDLTAEASKLSLGGAVENAAATARMHLGYDAQAKTLNLNTKDTPLKASLQLAGQPWTVDLPSLAVTYGPETAELHVQTSGASAGMPQAAFKDVNIDVTATISPYPVAQGSLSVGVIESTVRPAYFTPLKLDARLVSLSSQQYTTGFDATLVGQAGALMLKAQGQHNSAANTGRLRARLEPLNMQAGITTLDEFVPVSKKYVSDVSGSLGAFGGVNWARQGDAWHVTSKGQIKLENVAGAYAGDFPFTGINSVVAFDSLVPPSFTRQQAAIGAFTAGLPLQNGLVTLSLKDGKTLSLHEGKMDMAGGKVVVAPFTLDLEKRTGRIVLGAGGLDLDKLFAVAPMDGLSASGEVDGTLPLQLNAGSITLDNGVLQSTGPGTLKYAPQILPSFLQDDTNPHMVTLRTALANFNFSNLRMGLRGDLLKDQAITLTIEGKNPDFYGGHPVKLNLNVEGPLQNILRYAPGTSTIPDTIERQLEQFEENNALSAE